MFLVGPYLSTSWNRFKMRSFVAISSRRVFEEGEKRRSFETQRETGREKFARREKERDREEGFMVMERVRVDKDEFDEHMHVDM